MINKLKNIIKDKIKRIAIHILIRLDPRVSPKNMVNTNSNNFIKPDEEDLKLAKIICDSYSHMSKKIKTVDVPYQIGEFWYNIVNDKKKDFYEPIKKGDISSASFVLANFFRTSGIQGLWEGGVIKIKGKDLGFISATLRNYDFWRVVTNQSPNVVNLPRVGNPIGYQINNSIVSIAQFKLHYHSQQVYNLIKDVGEKAVVVEIGGGFGGIIYYLFKMGFKGTYLEFDIPETLILAEYFVKKVFPDKKVLIYNGEKSITSDDINNYDIILMPNYMLKEMPDLSADIVVNTRSFSEMPYVTIEEYMIQIDRICKKYLYHDNANYKSHSDEVPAYEFPIPESFRLLIKVKSLWYGGFDVNNRFVEYLYERKKT